jgi:hypothetical protein
VEELLIAGQSIIIFQALDATRSSATSFAHLPAAKLEEGWSSLIKIVAGRRSLVVASKSNNDTEGWIKAFRFCAVFCQVSFLHFFHDFPFMTFLP